MKKLILGLLMVTMVGSAFTAIPAAHANAPSKSIVESKQSTVTYDTTIDRDDELGDFDPNEGSAASNQVTDPREIEQLEAAHADDIAKLRGAAAAYIASPSASASVAAAPKLTRTQKIEKVVKSGMNYLGTPYEFGSNRENSKTFDCSDFVRWIYRQATGITMPTDSRKQAAYVKKIGKTTTNWKNLKRGDLMFFMSYKGAKPADYKKLNKQKQRVTHVGLYLGNGKVLHTYSKKSGGVLVQSFVGTPFEYRFIFGGSIL
ncbi:C40 family peptidase [Paenibacillus guangzhouensis]|uniref:C40 family peptidase n=1 Tax=Paenibacillus guangzhouensis TaxID=1473112 RepID=UPI001D0F5D03|nr:C40 family peptidase [Paenibacillus guangzhouensis]